MTGYVMEAKENYDPTRATILDGTTGLPVEFVFMPTDNTYAGQSYDPVSRLIFYSWQQASDDPLENTTGFTLNDGYDTVGNGDDYISASYRNFWVATKSIDSPEAVTFYNGNDDTTNVPNGIAGSNGTHLYMINAIKSIGCVPKLVDPRTQNLLFHAFTDGTAPACEVYLLRNEDAYAQVIFPLAPESGFNHMQPLGCSEDWWYIRNDFVGAGNSLLLLTPREITAPEIANGYLLTYATFDMQYDVTNVYWRFTMTTENTGYLIVMQKSGSRGYKLWKFEEPTSAPFGGPVVGGGFTDVTPWAGGTGPNSDAAAYQFNGGNTTGNDNKNIIMWMPDTQQVVMICKFLPGDTGSGVTDRALLQFGCCYFDETGSSFTYYSAFIQGYIEVSGSTYTFTDDPTNAVWAVQDVREVNTYLQNQSYEFTENYAPRRFFMTVQPVVAGVWTPNAANNHILILEYDFSDDSAPPVLISVVDEQGWDDRYTDYATAINNDNVIAQSMTDQSDLNDAFYDFGVYDDVSAAYWWSGKNRNMFFLDEAFLNRDNNDQDPSSPFLKMYTTSSFSGRRRAGNAVKYTRIPRD